jgi:nucleoside-diphosphate-sugar epimerase
VKSALVTGSHGFIGRHISRALWAQDYAVTPVDIKSGRDCREIFKTSKYFDLVVHCAAIVGGRATIDGQPMKVATDLAIDSDFFQFVARTQPRKAVYFSSSAAYPIAYQLGGHYANRLEEIDIDLNQPDLPDAVYGWVKLTGEQMAQYANAAGANIQVFRPFSGYGTDQDLDYPFPSFIKRAYDKVEEFDIWGPGTQVRDWVHVDDVVGAVLAVLEHDNVGPINIATGIPTSFLELAGLVMTISGHHAPVKVHPEAPTGVMYRVGDPTKMLGFYEPKVSLFEGIKRALEGR